MHENTAKYTPGPWSYHERQPWGGPYSQLEPYVKDANGAVIVNGCAPGGTEEAKANARLISLAPRMVDALRDWVQLMDIAPENTEQHHEQAKIARVILREIDEEDA